MAREIRASELVLVLSEMAKDIPFDPEIVVHDVGIYPRSLIGVRHAPPVTVLLFEEREEEVPVPQSADTGDADYAATLEAALMRIYEMDESTDAIRREIDRAFGRAR